MKKLVSLMLILLCIFTFGSCKIDDSNLSNDITTQNPTETVREVLIEGSEWKLYKNGVLHIETDAGARNWAAYSSDHYFTPKWKEEWRSEVVPIVQKIVLEEGVTVLPEHTALNLSNLSEIELPDTIQIIEKEALFICPNLHEVAIPRNVSRIEGVPVTGDYETQWELRISVNPENMWYEVTDGMLIEKETRTLLYAYSTEEEIEVPAYVRSVIRYAFLNCFQLKTLYINTDCEVDEYAVAGHVAIVRK